MDRYGKESEIVKAYVQNILDLPRIKGTNPQKNSSVLRTTVVQCTVTGNNGKAGRCQRKCGVDDRQVR